ncbi:MAG: SDR family NAD(P)-dependent oxidoreductase [Lachnospiraceae bacterium]
MKNVLVTGASHGIGKEIAHIFIKNGYRVFMNCRTSKKELLDLAEIWNEEFRTQCIPLIYDVSDDAQVEEMFQEIKAILGRGDGSLSRAGQPDRADFNSAYGRLEEGTGIDILVNNAGISHVGLLSDMTAVEWNRVIATNLSSVFYCSRRVIPHMVHKKAGKIINISSVWGNVGASCEVAYSASKGGVNAFTKALAKELAPSNIQVNAIACGTIDTRMNHCFSQEEREALKEEIPAGRFGSAEEVAQLVLQLAEGNDYLNGQIITLDGAWC